MKLRLQTHLIAVALVAISTIGFSQNFNHLRGQRSPYLSRAARQAVDWRPFGKRAFEEARRLHRPILLDVGAVWCPWCERMDRESYTLSENAAFINHDFVAVKVDYDEAGPLVAQLERAQAVLNLPAGLPLTSFITPAGDIYYGAGYLPPDHRKDQISFRDALTEALRLFKNQSKTHQDSFKLNLEGVE
jgi:uncharacterized protein